LTFTIRSFRDLCHERIPTASEFVEFVAAQGWRISVKPDGRASIRGDSGNPIILALARMLAREPYRSNVLAEAATRWHHDAEEKEQPQPDIEAEECEAPDTTEARPARYRRRRTASTEDIVPPDHARPGGLPLREWITADGVILVEWPDDPGAGWHPEGAAFVRGPGELEWQTIQKASESECARV